MNIPKAPKFSLALIGPGVVLVAMGLGSGEYILWPYLIAQFGFGILWGAVVGVYLQYIISSEGGRYTLASGGSIYSAFHKLNKYLPLWFIISTFASFAWPGIIGSGGAIFANLLNIQNQTILGISAGNFLTLIMLIVIGCLLTFGGKVYDNLEKIQKLVILITIPLLIIIASMLINVENATKLTLGLVGVGEGYLFLPQGISIMAFLASLAYSGAAGNLVLSHSFYIQDEGLGMAKNVKSQIHLNKKNTDIPEAQFFDITTENLNQFRKWFGNISKELFLSFFVIGILTIVLIALISYALVYPYQGVNGLNFIYLQAEQLSFRFGNIFGVFFLSIGVIFLFKTQLGIFETTSRIMTENIQLFSPGIKKNVDRSKLFFGFLWSQIAFASIITLFGFEQPIQVLILGTFFSALSMFVLSFLVYILNNSNLMPKEIRPSFFRNFVMVFSTLFFGIFVILTTWEEVIVRISTFFN